MLAIPEFTLRRAANLILSQRTILSIKNFWTTAFILKKELEQLPGKNTLTAALTRSLTIRYQHVVLPLADIVDDNGVLTLFIMSDGAHHFWEHRPRFSLNTLGNVSSFTASLYKRILKKTPTDDYSLIAAQFKVS